MANRGIISNLATGKRSPVMSAIRPDCGASDQPNHPQVNETTAAAAARRRIREK